MFDNLLKRFSSLRVRFKSNENLLLPDGDWLIKNYDEGEVHIEAVIGQFTVVLSYIYEDGGYRTWNTTKVLKVADLNLNTIFKLFINFNATLEFSIPEHLDISSLEYKCEKLYPIVVTCGNSVIIRHLDNEYMTLEDDTSKGLEKEYLKDILRILGS